MTARKDKLKGKVMQVEGKLTGDRIRTAEGTVKKTKGDVGSMLGRAGRRVMRTARRVRAKIAGDAR